MSGIYRSVVTAKAVLACDAPKCSERWESEVYQADGFRSEDSHVGPALADGWRIFAGGRGQRTYCPGHGPRVPMRLVRGDGS